MLHEKDEKKETTLQTPHFTIEWLSIVKGNYWIRDCDHLILLIIVVINHLHLIIEKFNYGTNYCFIHCRCASGHWETFIKRKTSDVDTWFAKRCFLIQSDDLYPMMCFDCLQHKLFLKYFFWYQDCQLWSTSHLKYQNF